MRRDMADLVVFYMKSGTRATCDRELAEKLGYKPENEAPENEAPPKDEGDAKRGHPVKNPATQGPTK